MFLRDGVTASPSGTGRGDNRCACSYLTIGDRGEVFSALANSLRGRCSVNTAEVFDPRASITAPLRRSREVPDRSRTAGMRRYGTRATRSSRHRRLHNFDRVPAGCSGRISGTEARIRGRERCDRSPRRIREVVVVGAIRV